MVYYVTKHGICFLLVVLLTLKMMTPVVFIFRDH